MKPEAGSRQPVAASMSIPREHRLRKHAEFDLVYKSGRRQFSSSFTAFFLPRPGTELAGPRVGITVGRQMGGAVRRNRMKRRLRSAIGQNLARLTAAVDVVINPKKIVFDMNFEQLCAEVARAFDAIAQKTLAHNQAVGQPATSAAKRQA
jgi:ribonuclease P protein component